MSDFGNVKITGNSLQKLKFLETFDAVKKYCDPDAASRLKDTEFIFDNNIHKDIDAILNSTITTKNNKIINYKHQIKYSENFIKLPIKERGGVLCHELKHIDYEKKQNNSYVFGSKEDESAAIAAQDSFKQNYSKAEGKFFKVRSKEEIKNYLNENPFYKCLPEKPPTTEEGKDKAVSEYETCKAGIKGNTSFFKKENSNEIKKEVKK